MGGICETLFFEGTGCHGISPSLAWKWGRGGRPWWDARRSHYGRKLPHWSGTGQAVMDGERGGCFHGGIVGWLWSGWQCRSRLGTKTPSPVLCASRAPIVVKLISSSSKKLFCRTVGVILQPLPGPFTAESGTQTISALLAEQKPPTDCANYSTG